MRHELEAHRNREPDSALPAAQRTRAAVQRHLAGLGLRATFEPIAVGDRVHSPATWEGAEAGRNWWHLDTYLLPVCVRE